MTQVRHVFQRLRESWGAEVDSAQIPAQVLAYLGDALYELFVRLAVLSKGPASIHDLHRRAVLEVRAENQARVLERLLPVLTPDELLVVRRGRNAHTHRLRRGALAAYSMSTGFEALLGYLFLEGRYERLEEIMLFSLKRDVSQES